MPPELLLAPVGAGKTETALARIASRTGDNPFLRVWVLLATERQVSQFRNRLVDETPGRRVHFNVEFFTFPELYVYILNASGQPARQLTEPARRRLLRVLAQGLAAQGELAAYGEIAHKPGFIQILANFIYELKGTLVRPDVFKDLIQRAFDNREKDTDIWHLYRDYQGRLREHDIVDRVGAGWLALDALQADPALLSEVDLLIVDGYDEFSRLQAAVMAQLAGRVGDALFTLTDVPDMVGAAGRRFNRAAQELRFAFKQAGVSFQENRLSPRGIQRHPDLQHLLETVFRLDDVTPVASSGGIAFLSAPDIPQEAAAVLRRVKQLLLSGGDAQVAPRPDDIMLALRDYQQYHIHLRALGQAYGIPMVFHLGQALPDTPPIRVLLDAITLHDTQVNLVSFPRRALLDVLQSPYVVVDGLGPGDIGLLDQISQELQVIGGREMWLGAIRAASEPRDLRDDDGDSPPSGALITATQREHLLAALTTFFDTLTPPDQAGLADYVDWIERLTGCDPAASDEDETQPDGYLNMVKCLRRPGVAEHIVNRDIAALDTFKAELKGLLGAQALLGTLESASGHMAWAEFLGDLQAALAHAVIERHPERHGRVLVTTAANARGLPHQHVFLLGMSEGIFPLRLTEDALYLNSERQQMSDAGLPLATTVERNGDDGLFYELVSLPRRSLTLSRPTVKNGAPWVPSHLWGAAASVFSDVGALIEAGGLQVGEVIPAVQAASHGEVRVAVAGALTETQVEAGIYNWLVDNEDPTWRHIRIAQAIERDRLRGAPPAGFDGQVTRNDLLNTLDAMLDIREHEWSASQLNDYGVCPFRFFAGRVLGLRALEPPEIGLDVRQLGTLNHRILEQTYNQLAADEVQITASNADEALERLTDIANGLLANAPTRENFRASPLWEQEKEVLLRRLQALVHYDFTEMNAMLAKKFDMDRPRYPYRMEASFGIGAGGKLVRLGDGHTVRLTGMIDRIDRYGDDVIVIDYKTGTTPIARRELEEGRNFQIMLYILAAQDLLQAQRGAGTPGTPNRVLGGFFWHIRNRAISGLLNTGDPQHHQMLISAENMLVDYIKRARAGSFAVQPSKLVNGRCVGYCDFYRLCRIANIAPDN